jgi:hypothetical protein
MVSNIRRTEIHTAEPLVPDTSPSEIKIAITNLQNKESPGSNQIPAEVIQAGSEILRFEVYELINYIRNKEELPDQWKESIIVSIYKVHKTGCGHYRGIPLLSTSSIMRSSFQGILPNV